MTCLGTVSAPLIEAGMAALAQFYATEVVKPRGLTQWLAPNPGFFPLLSAA